MSLPAARGARILALLALLMAVAFLGAMLTATGGHFVPPNVDLYVVCQYARAMAEGHAFHYNAGEPASTGATSLLQTVLFALAYALGAHGEGLVAVACLMGMALYVASVVMALRIGRLISGDGEALLAGGLVALGGPVVWGFLYGSDIALFMFLSLCLLERLLAGWSEGALGGVAAAGALLALARPEGLPIGLMLGAGWTLAHRRTARGARKLWIWLPAATGGAVFLLNRALTGQWLSTSVADKSLLANYGFLDSLALVTQYSVDVIRGLLLGFYPSEARVGLAQGWAPFYFPPLGLVLVLVALARPREACGAPLRLWALTVALLFALLAPNVFMGVQFNRYLLWAVPSLLVLAAAGLGTAAQLAARNEPGLQSSLFRAGARLMLLLGLLPTVRFATLYASMAGEVQRRDVAAAEWISHNLPAGSAMLNLATSVEFLTGHRNLNLHGVTTPAFFGGRTAEREAGVFEALGRLPRSERPPYLITSVAAQESYASMREVVEGAPLFRTSSLSDEILVYRTRYDIVDRGPRLFLPETLEAVRGLHEVDSLNVCDSRDEARHDYSFSSRLGDLRLFGTARIDAYELPDGGRQRVIDGGRAILGEESFRVAFERGKDLVIVLRTAPSVNVTLLRASGGGVQGIEIAPASITIEAGGRLLTRSTFRPRAGWDEQLLRVPAAAIEGGATRLRVSGRYASFRYWFYQ